jgi:hypothetical protein
MQCWHAGPVALSIRSTLVVIGYGVAILDLMEQTKFAFPAKCCSLLCQASLDWFGDVCGIYLVSSSRGLCSGTGTLPWQSSGLTNLQKVLKHGRHSKVKAVDSREYANTNHVNKKNLMTKIGLDVCLGSCAARELPLICGQDLLGTVRKLRCHGDGWWGDRWRVKVLFVWGMLGENEWSHWLWPWALSLVK